MKKKNKNRFKLTQEDNSDHYMSFDKTWHVLDTYNDDRLVVSFSGRRDEIHDIQTVRLSGNLAIARDGRGKVVDQVDLRQISCEI